MSYKYSNTRPIFFKRSFCVILNIDLLPECEDPLPAPGLLDGAPHHSILGGGDGELPSLAHLDLAGLVLTVGIVGVKVSAGRAGRAVVARLGRLSALEAGGRHKIGR